MDEYVKIQQAAGLDSEEAAKRSKDFMQALTQLQSTIEAVVTKVLTDLEPTLTEKLNALSQWFIDHKDDIKSFIIAVTQAIEDLIEDLGKLIEAFKPVFKTFDDMAKALTGKDGLQAAFETFAVFLAGSWLLRVLGVFKSVGIGWLALAALVGFAPNSMEQAKANGDAINDAIGGTGIFKWWNNNIRNPVRKMFGLSPVDARGNTSSASSDQNVNFTGDASDITAARGHPRQFLNAVYKNALDAGLTDTQARLMAAQAGLESGFGMHAPGNNFFGIKAGRSWTGDTQTLATTEYGPNGPYRTMATFRKYATAAEGLRDRIEFMKSHFPRAWNAETLDDAIAELKNGRFGSYATDSNYDSSIRGVANQITYDPVQAMAGKTPKQQEAANQNFSQAHPAFDWAQNASSNLGSINSSAPLTTAGNTNNVTLQQNTNISVMGSGDPTSTANAVANRQSSVNSLMLRNTQGAVR
ncbi:glycoside hydrolase family 73 protein [Rhizobium sp. No.120]